MTTGLTKFPRFRTRRAIRQYVESELDGLSRRWPDLHVAFGTGDAFDVPPPGSRCWIVRSAKWDKTGHLLDRHYLLEARPSTKEFIVWFGALRGFRWKPTDPRPWMRTAVHIPFPRRGDERQYCGIGAVVRLMLERQEQPDSSGWDPAVYPMNGSRY